MVTSQVIFDAIAVCDCPRLRQLIDANPLLATARNEAGLSALMFAVYHRHAEMVRLLRETVPETDLFEAAALGDTDRLEALLENAEAVAKRSSDGFTPLHLAAFFNQIPTVRRLLAAGADPNAAADNPSRVQPLHSAVAAQSLEVVRLLLEHGAQPNGAQHGGWTALQSAAKHGELAMVELLVQHGADPNQPADSGETAISMAANDQVLARLRAQDRKDHSTMADDRRK